MARLITTHWLSNTAAYRRQAICNLWWFLPLLLALKKHEFPIEGFKIVHSPGKFIFTLMVTGSLHNEDLILSFQSFFSDQSFLVTK